MKSLLVASLMVLSSVAMADGFKCEQLDSGLNIKVFNKTDASAGTRNAAVMVLSDSNIGSGNKTIASFKANKRTLGQNGTSYMAQVDLRVSESSRSGENILGTKLGQIAKIYVDVDHNYNEPMANGEYTTGTISIEKRNGDVKSFDLDCARYLKN